MQITANKDGQDYGPFSLEELQRQVANGTFTLEDYAWYEGCEEWIYMADVPGIQDAPKPAAKAGGVFIEQNGKQKGPFPVAQLQGMVNQGVVPLETPAWMEGWDDWATVQDVEGIKKPRVKVAGGKQLPEREDSVGKDKDGKKKKKKGGEEEEEAETKEVGDAPRKRRKKKDVLAAEKAAKKGGLVPAIIGVVVLALLGGGGFFAWKAFFSGEDVEDDDDTPVFSSRGEGPKKNTPPEDPWELNEWRKKRQK